MKIRSFALGAALFALGTWGMAGGAQAKAAPLVVPKGCVVNSLPSFMDQGLGKSAESVADIVEVECELSGKLAFDGSVRISNTTLRNRCGGKLSWIKETTPGNVVIEATTTVTVPLDADGNATVAVIAGPGCKPGGSEFLAEELGAPDEKYSAAFEVLAAKTTEASVAALDPCPEKAGVCHSKVESDSTSSAFTIIQIELPVAQAKVDVDASQMFFRCGGAPHTVWITGAPAVVHAISKGQLIEGSALETDEEGNVWVLLIGTHSCQPGKVVIEATEEFGPFTSVFGQFRLEYPRVTI